MRSVVDGSALDQSATQSTLVLAGHFQWGHAASFVLSGAGAVIDQDSDDVGESRRDGELLVKPARNQR
jgi:hypothetical protein